MVLQNILCQPPRSPVCVGARVTNGSFRRPLLHSKLNIQQSLFFERRQGRWIRNASSGENNPSSSVTDKTESIAPYLAKEVSEETWDAEVLKSSVPVLVDFWAPWCGPCKMLGPTIDEIIEEYGNKFKVVKLNTDKSPGIATQYGIRSIPTCMMFKNGSKVDSVIGAVRKQDLKNSMDKLLS